MKEKQWRVHISGRMARAAAALLCFVFALMITDAKAPDALELSPALPTPGIIRSAAEKDQTLRQDCQIIQTMAFSRCGHSVTRRISPPPSLQGANFEAARAYYEQWLLEEFTPASVIMRREIALYCPMHQVLGVNEAGHVVRMKNLYGDGMAVQAEYDRNLSQFPDEIKAHLLAGIGFDSTEEAEAWLMSH